MLLININGKEYNNPRAWRARLAFLDKKMDETGVSQDETDELCEMSRLSDFTRTHPFMALDNRLSVNGNKYNDAAAARSHLEYLKELSEGQELSPWQSDTLAELLKLEDAFSTHMLPVTRRLVEVINEIEQLFRDDPTEENTTMLHAWGEWTDAARATLAEEDEDFDWYKNFRDAAAKKRKELLDETRKRVAEKKKRFGTYEEWATTIKERAKTTREHCDEDKARQVKLNAGVNPNAVRMSDYMCLAKRLERANEDLEIMRGLAAREKEFERETQSERAEAPLSGRAQLLRASAGAGSAPPRVGPACGTPDMRHGCTGNLGDFEDYLRSEIKRLESVAAATGESDSRTVSMAAGTGAPYGREGAALSACAEEILKAKFAERKEQPAPDKPQVVAGGAVLGSGPAVHAALYEQGRIPADVIEKHSRGVGPFPFPVAYTMDPQTGFVEPQDPLIGTWFVHRLGGESQAACLYRVVSYDSVRVVATPACARKEWDGKPETLLFDLLYFTLEWTNQLTAVAFHANRADALAVYRGTIVPFFLPAACES